MIVSIRRVAAVSIAVLALGACSRGSDSSTTQVGGPSTTNAPATSTSSTELPSTSTTSSPSTTTVTSTTTTTALPSPPPPEEHGWLRPGDDNPDVALLQLRLAELGYRPGTGDGHYGAATASAVMAFQKREGLSRDGIAGAEVLGRLANPSGAGARNPSGPRHLEIDLDRQIGLFVADDGTTTTVNISSGNGASYVNPKTRVRSRAITPVGEFAVYRKVDGTERAPLGTLYRPAYFKGGWAVHGSPSVPGYPASHGCVRASNADQDWMFPQLNKGTPVIIYTGPPQAAATTEPLPADAAPGG